VGGGVGRGLGVTVGALVGAMVTVVGKGTADGMVGSTVGGTGPGKVQENAAEIRQEAMPANRHARDDRNLFIVLLPDRAVLRCCRSYLSDERH